MSVRVKKVTQSPLKGKKTRIHFTDGTHLDRGDSSMSDYRSHKSEKRKKAYHSRHRKNLQGNSKEAMANREHARRAWRTGGYLKDKNTYVTKDGRETERGLWANVYLKQKREGKKMGGGELPMAKDGKWISKAIKRPGRMKRYAKSQGLSMSEAIAKAKKSSDPSLSSAAKLGERFRKGDLSRKEMGGDIKRNVAARTTTNYSDSYMDAGGELPPEYYIRALERARDEQLSPYSRFERMKALGQMLYLDDDPRLSENDRYMLGREIMMGMGSPEYEGEMTGMDNVTKAMMDDIDEPSARMSIMEGSDAFKDPYGNYYENIPKLPQKTKMAEMGHGGHMARKGKASYESGQGLTPENHEEYRYRNYQPKGHDDAYYGPYLVHKMKKMGTYTPHKHAAPKTRVMSDSTTVAKGMRRGGPLTGPDDPPGKKKKADLSEYPPAMQAVMRQRQAQMETASGAERNPENKGFFQSWKDYLATPRQRYRRKKTAASLYSRESVDSPVTRMFAAMGMGRNPLGSGFNTAARKREASMLHEASKDFMDEAAKTNYRMEPDQMGSTMYHPRKRKPRKKKGGVLVQDRNAMMAPGISNGPNEMNLRLEAGGMLISIKPSIPKIR